MLFFGTLKKNKKKTPLICSPFWNNKAVQRWPLKKTTQKTGSTLEPICFRLAANPPLNRHHYLENGPYGISGFENGPFEVEDVFPTEGIQQGFWNVAHMMFSQFLSLTCEFWTRRFNLQQIHRLARLCLKTTCHIIFPAVFLTPTKKSQTSTG